jgi:hypothetical protein
MSSHLAAMAAILGTESPSFAADKKGEPVPPWRKLLWTQGKKSARPSTPPRSPLKKVKTEKARPSSWLPAKKDWQSTQDEWEVGQESAPASFGVSELAVDVEQEDPPTDEDEQPGETWDAEELAVAVQLAVAVDAEHVQEEEEEAEHVQEEEEQGAPPDFKEALKFLDSIEPVRFEDTPRFLPNRTRNVAVAQNTQPKMKPKPSGTADFPREVAKRSREDREKARSSGAGALEKEVPWDCRGPPAPQHGGPDRWCGQKYRQGSGRWANSGGRNKEKYALFNKKKASGLRGTELQFWAPMAPDGYWAREAHQRGELSPVELRDAERC